VSRNAIRLAIIQTPSCLLTIVDLNCGICVAMRWEKYPWPGFQDLIRVTSSAGTPHAMGSRSLQSD
jgi:hypothetical protein